MSTRGYIQIGQRAPDFTGTAVVDGSFKEVALSDYTETKNWLVLVFFPRAWSFLGPSEICAFSDRLEEFVYSRQCHVIFSSTDSLECLQTWTQLPEKEGGLGPVHLPLLSDSNHSIARDYGVLDEMNGHPQRALFIIDPKGIVRAITINDVDSGRSVDETQRLLDALAIKDEFGENHPGSWRKESQSKSSNGETKSSSEDEAPIFKKSWSQWARPKLQRAWSGTSVKSDSSSSGTKEPETPLISPTSVPEPTQAANDPIILRRPRPPHVIPGGETAAERQKRLIASQKTLQKALDAAHSGFRGIKIHDPSSPGESKEDLRKEVVARTAALNVWLEERGLHFVGNSIPSVQTSPAVDQSSTPDSETFEIDSPMSDGRTTSVSSEEVLTFEQRRGPVMALSPEEQTEAKAMLERWLTGRTNPNGLPRHPTPPPFDDDNHTKQEYFEHIVGRLVEQQDLVWYYEKMRAVATEAQYHELDEPVFQADHVLEFLSGEYISLVRELEAAGEPSE